MRHLILKLPLISGVRAGLAGWSQRRHLKQLLTYSDQTLNDIGLHRTDINMALYLPRHKSAFDVLTHWYQQHQEVQPRRSSNVEAVIEHCSQTHDNVLPSEIDMVQYERYIRRLRADSATKWFRQLGRFLKRRSA
jgi:hypothetical protein